MSSYNVNIGNANNNVVIGDRANIRLTIKNYQDRTAETAVYPSIGPTALGGAVYPVLGLTNEAGEVAGKIKKLFRDKGGVVNYDDLLAVKAELGDVFWYLAQCATALGLSLEEIAQENLDKLADRMARGKIQGSGDNR